MNTRFYEFGPFRIDKLNYVLLRDGAPVPLKPKVFDTLVVLVESRDRVLDKNELMSRLWPDTVVEEANLSQNIYLLRKVLGEGSSGEAYIATLPKRGYRFVAPVSEITEVNAGTIPIEPANGRCLPEVFAEASNRFEHQAPNRKVNALALLLCLLGLSLAFALSYFPKKNGPAPIAHVKSLAILPFKALGSDALDEVQRFGMTDTLITQLSNTSRVVVRPMSAVRKFQSGERDPVAAGRELQVDTVLVTNMQRVGNTLRVTMQLVRVSDGSAVWDGKFDHEANDFLAISNRVSEQIAQALIPEMTGEEQKLFSKRYTQNPEAYQLYLLGRYHWSKIDRPDWHQAVEYFNKAIEKDPKFALAYTKLAGCYLSFMEAGAIQKAKEATLTAISLDDTLAEAHVWLGMIKAYHDWDWSGAEGHFKQAIELNPNYSDAHGQYAGLLTAVLRTGEAIEEAERARALDPLSPQANYLVVRALISARYYEHAIAQSEQLLGTFPDEHQWIGYGYLGQRRYDRASVAFERKLDINMHDSLTTAHLAYAYGLSGRRSDANRVLGELKNPPRPWQVEPYYVAIAYAGLNDKDQTFEWLEKAYHERSLILAFDLKVNPVWDNLRSDPRFADLLRRVGLPK